MKLTNGLCMGEMQLGYRIYLHRMKNEQSQERTNGLCRGRAQCSEYLEEAFGNPVHFKYIAAMRA